MTENKEILLQPKVPTTHGSPRRWREGAVVATARRLLGALVLVTCLTLVTMPAANAGVVKPNVLPPNSHAFGETYGSWSVAWWQYVLSQPVPSNPLLDPTGEGCGVAQTGPVFFLVGTTGGSGTRDLCVVPHGKALFFPLFNGIDVHTEPGDGADTPKLAWKDLHDAAGFSVSSLFALIDGVPLKNLKNVQTTPYRACAGPARGCAPSFSVTLPDDNLFGIPSGTYAPAVADGYFLLLPPLRSGHHTVSFGGSGNLVDPFSVETTYHLTVKGK